MGKTIHYSALFLLICFTLTTHKCFSQLSKKHYIPPLTSGEPNADPQDQWIYISTPNDGLVPYTITEVGNATIAGTVSNATPQIVSIGNGYDTQLFQNSDESSTITNDKGYIIEADAPIYVSVRMNAGEAQAGALVSKGASAPDTRFRIGTFTSENPSANFVNFLSVMATEDDTTIDFSNLPSGLIIENYSGATPFNITLDEGESYIIAIKGDSNSGAMMDGLIGCLVESNKPIVVNCGSANGSLSNGGGRDYGIDQIAGALKIGNEYIFVRGDGADAWENIVVVADTDNTAININDNATPIATLNAGEYFVIEGNNYSTNGNMYVETSQNVFMYQGIGSTQEANQGMFFVPPLSCETRGNIDNIANIDNIGNTIYSGGLSIVTKRGALVTINNQPLSNFAVVGPSDVDGKTDYVTYQITGLTNDISVQGNDELYVAYYNVNGFATSGSFYSGFPSPPEINFDLQFEALGNCIPNVTLEAANAQNFDTFDWLYDDGSGSGFTSLNLNTTSITPTLPGKYKLIGIITCTMQPLESTEIPVSICPDDRDNDGIIDNIDIDNDNDGIENCEESNGNVIIDLSNANTPLSVFENTPLTSPPLSITSSGNTANINGDNTGNFTSNLDNTVTAPSEYTLNFNEPINIKFTSHTTVVNSEADDESYIARVLPSNKNITLVDPDDQLLVDSNFDGVFETGITQISGSEIHFKINTAATGGPSYQFLANQVDGFAFIHTPSTTAVPSSFSGNISLTCYKKDNDGDGVKDEFDMDSDNDGIPDIIERWGTIITLSGDDNNNDGLDDIFANPTLSIDTDGDGILDIYDLDSDNDGIYDVIESGLPPNLDSDFNGMIDNIDDGSNDDNGWADAAETAPDSNQIGYTLNDLDNDSVFSYLDEDSDGDFCNDVIEAGFSDGNNDDYLGDNLPMVDNNGKVTNAIGYTTPNTDYLTSAPIVITAQPENIEVCEGSDNNISLISTTFDTIQWEVSTDGINWNTISDGAIYSDSDTPSLLITNTPLMFNGYAYRALLNRNGNSCGLYSNEVNITVNPKPIVNSPVTLVQCDDDNTATLGFSAFNLNEANEEISVNAANETFTYYLTEAAAILGDQSSPDFIANPTTFENRTINNDVVWARIESQQGCVNTAEVQLVVSTTVIPSNFLVQFYQCDDFLDINGNNNANNDNRDGVATFNFSSVNNAILSFIPTGQNPLPPRFYRNAADALAEENEITDITNYRNIGHPGSQFIYVRVDSAIANDCLGLGAHIELIVETLPIANSVTITPECDTDLTDNYIAYEFDTSSIEAGILNGQSLADVSITYEYVDILGTPVTSSTLPNPFLTETQDVRVVVTNTNTQAPDGPCEDETIIRFVVDEQPVIAATVPNQEFCDGDAGDIDDDGFYPFATTTFASTILGSQIGTMDIYFEYTDENGDRITNATSLPDPLNSRSQTIEVRVENPMNALCIAPTEINLIVNPVPEFEIVVDDDTICISGGGIFETTLYGQQVDPTATFIYEWRWNDENSTVISSNQSLTISDAGVYYLSLIATDGTGCKKTKEVTIQSAQAPVLNSNNIRISPPYYIHTVGIIDVSLLGPDPDDYEFALVKNGSNTIIYQDDPVFTNVSPGFYTLYARDKRQICETVQLNNISIVGYPQFFTPNGDGFHEVWNIKGINEATQAGSIIRIYDRYGKLLKQIFPSSNQGWDGTFNGQLMPTDDYWFKVNLEDGTSFMGHFTLKR
ncbi:hypothetical protein MHTCC0001_14470 [Flavobacteriaceae bacterium MHTCC 0001]